MKEKLIIKNGKKGIFYTLTAITIIFMIIIGGVLLGTLDDYFLNDTNKSYSTRINYSEKNFTANIYLKFVTNSTDFWAEDIVHVTIGVESSSKLLTGGAFIPNQISVLFMMGKLIQNLIPWVI